MTLSIIIPTFNEAEHIGSLVQHLKKNANGELRELIVADGGSTDNTIQIAKAAGAQIINCSDKGRACQMNQGVKNTTGEILYFVHADSIPPQSYVADIKAAIQENYPIGCFRFKFDSPKKILRFNSFMTRFDKMYCRGGDQSLFVERSIFEELDGYKSDYKIMEEYDFIIRAKAKYPFKIIPKEVLVSARKYDDRSWLRVMIANGVVYNMFRWGASQDRLVKTYKKLLK